MEAEGSHHAAGASEAPSRTGRRAKEILLATCLQLQPEGWLSCAGWPGGHPSLEEHHLLLQEAAPSRNLQSWTSALVRLRNADPKAPGSGSSPGPRRPPWSPRWYSTSLGTALSTLDQGAITPGLS